MVSMYLRDSTQRFSKFLRNDIRKANNYFRYPNLRCDKYILRKFFF